MGNKCSDCPLLPSAPGAEQGPQPVCLATIPETAERGPPGREGVWTHCNLLQTWWAEQKDWISTKLYSSLYWFCASFFCMAESIVETGGRAAGQWGTTEMNLPEENKSKEKNWAAGISSSFRRNLWMMGRHVTIFQMTGWGGGLSWRVSVFSLEVL